MADQPKLPEGVQPGSPEANEFLRQHAAKKDAAGLSDTPGDDVVEPGEGGDSDDDGGDEGRVTLSAAEHRRLQAENRRLKRQEAKREAETREAEAKRTREEAEARGDYESARQQAEERVTAAEQKARRAAARVALNEAMGERGWQGDAQKLARKLIDYDGLEYDGEGEPTPEAVAAALDGLADEYPATFAEPAEPAAGPEKPGANVAEKPKQPARQPVRRTPATPEQPAAPFDGYVSPEELARTPLDVRYTREFQERIERSRPYYPKTVPRESFPQG